MRLYESKVEAEKAAIVAAVERWQSNVRADRAARKAAKKAKPFLWSARCHIQTGTFRFYHALALLGVMRSAPSSESAALKDDLEASLAALRTLAGSAPHTYTHKHALAGAELARVEGRDLEVMRLYEQAVRTALEKGFIQEAALGAELAADFFARRGLEKIAPSNQT